MSRGRERRKRKRGKGSERVDVKAIAHGRYSYCIVYRSLGTNGEREGKCERVHVLGM